MAEGFSAQAANGIVDAHIAAYPWIQLHIGAPGADGLANAAGNATRKDCTSVFGVTVSGVATSTSAVVWDAPLGAAEQYTHVTYWSLASGGSFGHSGTITANTVAATGESFTIPIGSLTITLPIATT